MERAWGERATSAAITIFVANVRISGGALAFFARSSAYTDLGGVWIANGLPPRALRLLAGSSKSAAAIAAGAFDARAETIAWPWSPTTVKSID